MHEPSEGQLPRTLTLGCPKRIVASILMINTDDLASAGSFVYGSSRFLGNGSFPQDSYLVDPASSHMLVSKIKPCMSKYKLLIL